MVVVPNGSIILAKETKLFRSTNEGESWNVIEEFTVTIKDLTINSDGDLLVLCNNSFFYKSSDLGESWTESYISNRGLSHILVDPSGSLYCFGFYYLNQDALFFKSSDGIVWDSLEIDDYNEISDIRTDISGRIYMSYEKSSDKGIVRSSDGGISWDKIFDGPAESVFFLDNSLIVLTKESGYFESQDDGITWSQKLNYYFLSEIVRLRNGELIARSKDGIYISHDQSETWQNVSNGLLEAYIDFFAVDDSGTIIVPTGFTHFNNLWKYTESEGTWRLISHEIPGQEYNIQFSGGFFWLRANDTLYKSVGDSEWSMVSFPSVTTRFSVSCADNGNCIFNTDNGLYWSPDFGDSLTLIVVDPDLYAHTGASLFLSQDTAFVVLSVHNYKSPLLRASYIYRSVNGGLTWSQVVQITDNENFAWDAQLIKDGEGTIYVGDAVYDNELFGSSDRGETWTLIDKPASAYGIFANDNYLYANINFRSIKRTNNFGETWEDYDEGLPEGSNYPMRAGVSSTSAGYVYVSIEYPDFNQKGSGFILMDIAGKQVKEILVNKDITTVDVSSLKPGIYILKGAGFARKFAKY
jgi:photosystem II stability/assembly factor-like uncharacterized protein